MITDTCSLINGLASRLVKQISFKDFMDALLIKHPGNPIIFKGSMITGVVYYKGLRAKKYVGVLSDSARDNNMSINDLRVVVPP